MQDALLTYAALTVLGLLALAGLSVVLLHVVTRLLIRLLGTGDD